MILGVKFHNTWDLVFLYIVTCIIHAQVQFVLYISMALLQSKAFGINVNKVTFCL